MYKINIFLVTPSHSYLVQVLDKVQLLGIRWHTTTQKHIKKLLGYYIVVCTYMHKYFMSIIPLNHISITAIFTCNLYATHFKFTIQRI